MKPIFLLFALVTFVSCTVQSQITDPKATEVWEPEPRKVTPGTNNSAPSDAIVLFDGSNFDEWSHNNKSADSVKWTLKDSSMTVKPKTGSIKTRRTFGNVQLHLEFRTPAVVKGEGQLRGNSGVFFQERYEVQILDSYDNRTYSNGQAAAIYKQHIPLVNACKKPGEWQTYDIIYTAPIFNKDGIKTVSGRLTVLQNGILVQNNVEIKGTVEYIGLPKNIAHDKGSLVLQDHGDLVSYRNIWVREL